MYDKETGLYYYNARFYNPEDGRFLTQDTYRGENMEPDTLHLYAYCANNPVNYVDPSGHKKAKIKWQKNDIYKPQNNRRYTKTYTHWHTGGYGKLRVVNRFTVYKKKIKVKLGDCESCVVSSDGTATYEEKDPISTSKSANRVGKSINVSAIFKQTKSSVGLHRVKSYRLTTYVKIKKMKVNGMYVRLGYKWERVK